MYVDIEASFLYFNKIIQSTTKWVIARPSVIILQFEKKKNFTSLCYNLYCLKLTFTFLFKVTTVLVSPLISVSMLENFVSITDIWSLSVRIWELSATDWVWRMVLCSRSSRWENWEFCPLLKWLVSDWKLPDFSQSKNQEVTKEACMLCSKK